MNGVQEFPMSEYAQNVSRLVGILKKLLTRKRKSLSNKKWIEKNPGKMKELVESWRLRNPDKYQQIKNNYKDVVKIKSQSVEFKIKKKAHDLKYYAKNRERILEWSRNHGKIYSKNNRDKINIYQRSYRQQISIRISGTMASMIRHQIYNKNHEHCFNLVGYTCGDLMKHLESKFKPGMTWDNYGRPGWEIDHIIPLYYFKITSKQDASFKEAWKLDNLQPLWGKENRSKGKKISKEWNNLKEFESMGKKCYTLKNGVPVRVPISLPKGSKILMKYPRISIEIRDDDVMVTPHLSIHEQNHECGLVGCERIGFQVPEDFVHGN